MSLSEVLLGGASKNLVTVTSLERCWLRNLVTEMSFCSRSLEMAPSSRRKFARAVSINLVTVISLDSRNLAVEEFKNWITVISRYLVTAISSAAVSRANVSRNLVTEMSSGR